MPLITTIDEIKQYIEANYALSIDVIAPSIAVAERRYLIPVLGSVQYNSLVSAYKNANNDISQIASDPLKNLAPLAQEVVANIAMMLAVPRLSVAISESGIRRNETNDSKTAFQYQEQNLQDSYENSGLDALEEMLEFMESAKDQYPDWTSSDAYTDKKKFIISSGIQFSNYYQIYRSRQTYMCLRYIMHPVENFAIKQVLGTGLFNAIKAGLKNDNLSDAYQNLIENYIGPAIARLTVAKGLLERAVEISEMGVTVQTKAPDHNRPAKEPAPDTKVDKMVAALNADASQYLQNLGIELDANAALYPDYVAPDAPTAYITINNTIDNSFFAMS